MILSSELILCYSRMFGDADEGTLDAESSMARLLDNEAEAEFTDDDEPRAGPSRPRPGPRGPGSEFSDEDEPRAGPSRPRPRPRGPGSSEDAATAGGSGGGSEEDDENATPNGGDAN